MREWLYVPLILLLTGGVVYLFCRSGLAVTKRIAALLFVFRPGRDGDQVKVDSCSGWVRHRFRPRESRSYEFRLEAQLSAGDVEVSLLDGAKSPLLRLTPGLPGGQVELDRAGRYYLRWDFKSASGRCELHW